MEGSTDHRTSAGRIPPQVNAPLVSAPAIRTVDVIRKKRDGVELSRSEIEYLVRGYTSGEIPDYQAAAWLMSAVIRGLTRAETAALTDAMLRSGEVLDLSEFSAKKIDKHSTGGVGDKTSLVLAPVAAAGGLIVPMISGRGLGHTGGTLDKLESIPGFNVNLPIPEFRRVLHTCGCAMIGQTAEIAPADRKLYALRDVTGTVESPYLICASIMSKKLAEGIDGLVLDVKTGSGAFMKKEEDAVFLAELMVETGERMGKQVVALITDMDQPLGLLVGGAAASVTQGRQMAEQLIRSGKALERFGQMVALQGGDSSVIADPRRLPQAEHKLDVLSLRSGCVMKIDCEAVGIACVVLGGGREKKEDSVDPSVGLALHKKVGDSVAAEEPLCTIHYNSEARAARTKTLIEASYHIGDTPPTKRLLIHRVIGKYGDQN